MVTRRATLLIIGWWFVTVAVSLIGETAVLRPREDYNVVTEKNLFRKLGWEPPKPGPGFRLLLTAIAEAPKPSPEEAFWAGVLAEEEASPNGTKPPERRNRALIARQGSADGFYVEEGDKIDDATVETIEARRVVLRKADGKEVVLTLEEAGFGAGGPAGPSRRPGGKPSKMGPSKQPPRRGGPPPNWRARMERFRNMSPEQRAEMRRRFRERRR